MSALVKPWICHRCALRSVRSRTSRASVSAASSRKYSSKPVPRDGRPFRMAVIGSGPAGFYTAYKVMSKVQTAVVDMYESLPVPYGLVRFGVAPDHPEVKNCEEKFEEVAQSPNFNFIGNIAIGAEPGSLPLKTIAPHYDAILFAYGASRERILGIAGEKELRGIYSARAFVGWYNGLPEYADLNPDLAMGEEAIIIGQGNVALDVARILLSDVDALRKTDITEAALDVLSRNRVKSVRVVGRRGPLQAAFTIKEARELLHLPLVSFSPIPPALFPPEIPSLPRASKRIMQLLQKGSPTPVSEAGKFWSLDFLLSPKSFNSAFSSSSPGQRLGSMTFEKTFLEPEPFDPFARATNTGETVDLPANLAFRSIGYKSEALPGLSDLGVPFDDRRGVIPTDEYGRVIDAKSKIHIPGMYTSGWVKRGPTGVIASTMNDAFSTAEAIARDWNEQKAFNTTSAVRNVQGEKDGWEGVRIEVEKMGCRRVSWSDWKVIDKAEREKGRVKGKEREKFTSVQEMLKALD